MDDIYDPVSIPEQAEHAEARIVPDVQPLQPVIKNARRVLPPKELESIKPIIKRLYIDEGWTFQQVQKFLRTHHNYNPTERQFAGLRRKWNMKKNTRTGERKKILEELEQSGASERGLVGNVTLSVEKVKRWKKEMNEGSFHSAERNQLRAADNNTLIRQPKSVAFADTETLLFSVKAYASGMYDQKLWLPVGVESSDISGGHDNSFAALDKFYSCCMSSFELMEKKKYVEAQKLLSNACGLLRTIILEGHSQTIIYLLAIIKDLSQGVWGSMDGVLKLLRDYISDVATLVLPERHPFRSMCRSLARMDQPELKTAIVLSSKSLAEVSERKVGRFDSTSVMNRLVYTRWAYSDDDIGKERVLRSLLVDMKAAPVVNREAMHNVMYSLSGCFENQRRFEEMEIIGQQYVAAAEGITYQGKDHYAMGLYLIARAQKELGKKDLAVANMRRVIDRELTRPQHLKNTWAIRNLRILEDWYREWEWIEAADKVKVEITILVERNTEGHENVY